MLCDLVREYLCASANVLTCWCIHTHTHTGMQLDQRARDRLLNMKVSRKRISAESKNSAPKGDFKIADPCLIDYTRPPLPPTSSSTVCSDSSFCRVSIGEGEGEEAADGGAGRQQARDVYVFEAARAKGGEKAEDWMEQVYAKIPKAFQIGLVVGGSGSGKSVFLRKHFQPPTQVEWKADEAVISHFASPEEASRRLMSVGLNAVPTWLKPYAVLSNGEKFRVNLARQVKSDVTIDNFTCITNRNVAAATSVSLARLIRRYSHDLEPGGFHRVVLATSFPDVIPWLSPDWVLFSDSATLIVNPTPCAGPSVKIDWTHELSSAQRCLQSSCFL